MKEQLTIQKLIEETKKFCEIERKTYHKELYGVTDGIGWISARNNLKETFDVLDTVYNINDLESGVLERI